MSRFRELTKILADENFPRVAVEALREQGHDVHWIRDTFPGIPDDEVLQIAERESRILLTQDKDFGRLAYRSHLPKPPALILFRLPPIPSLLADYTKSLFAEERDLRGLFIVVELDRIRERTLQERIH